MRVERSAGGVMFRRLPNNVIEVLVIQDSHDGWAFPKGRIEEGETPIQAARRETAEEVGLREMTLNRPLGRSEFWFTDRWEQPGEKVHKFIDHFLFEVPAEASPQAEPEERIQAVRWVALNELHQVVTYKTLQPIVSRVQEILRNE